MSLAIKTHFYKWWVSRDINSGDMIQEVEDQIVKMKQDVLKRRYDDIRTAREVEDGVHPPEVK
jgi:hypothetical protein